MLGVAVVLVLLLIVVKVIRLWRQKTAPIRTAIYDYVDPPQLPPRKPQEIISSSNVAYGSNIANETNTSTAAGSIQLQRTGSSCDQTQSYTRTDGGYSQIQTYKEAGGQIQSYEKASGDYDQMQSYEKATGVTLYTIC